MAEFGIDTDITEELGNTIGIEGNNFEEQIHTIQQKVEECASSWTNGGYPTFKDQTEKAAVELTKLREFFDRYGNDVVGFSNQSREAINEVNTAIKNNY